MNTMTGWISMLKGKYTKEYYKIERLLGEDAKLAENEIQERINKLLAKTRSGANERPDFMKLTHSEFVKYTPT